MKAAYEYNYYVVSAVGKGSTVRLGYELLQRPKGTRKWIVVGRTQERDEAERWADGK